MATVTITITDMPDGRVHIAWSGVPEMGKCNTIHQFTPGQLYGYDLRCESNRRDAMCRRSGLDPHTSHEHLP